MSGMPHVVETGPLFSGLADRYSAANQAERLDLLTHLYNSPLIVPDSGVLSGGTAAGTMSDPALDVQANSTPTQAARTKHVNQHWFGLIYDSATNTHEPKQPVVTGGDVTTGWWNKWRGDSHGIMRETLIRALELSLGLEHLGGAPDSLDTPPEPDRCWQIHFLWVCGSPKFEGWLHWRRNVGSSDPDDGVVTVVFSTPGNTESPLSLTLLPEDVDQTPPPGERLVNDGHPHELVGAAVDAAVAANNVYDITTPWAGYVDTNAIGNGPLAAVADQTSGTMRTDRGLVVVGHARSRIMGRRRRRGLSATTYVSPVGDWTFGGSEDRNKPGNNEVGPREWVDGSDSPIVCVAPDSASDGGQLP